MKHTIKTSCWRRIGKRVARCWRVKIAWTAVCLGGFMVLYVMAQRIEFFTARSVPVTVIDKWIGFDPRWTAVYESLWLLLPIGPWLAGSALEVRRYLIGFALMCAVAFPVFVCWPVDAPRPAVIPDDPMYRLLVSIDGTRNSIPSLHAALALYTLLVAQRLLRPLVSPLAWKLTIMLGTVWCGAILYATVATRQHWFIDLPPGLLLAAAAYAYAWHLSKPTSNGDLSCSNTHVTSVTSSH